METHLRSIVGCFRGRGHINQSMRPIVQKTDMSRHHYSRSGPQTYSENLWIDLSQESLAKAENLFRSSPAAEAIREVTIGLSYRPAELATDFDGYRRLRLSDLQVMDDRCDYFPEAWNWSTKEERADTNEKWNPQRAEAYEDASDTCGWIRHVWEQLPNELEGEDLEWQKILLRGFAEYRRRHEEQLRLLTDGSFVRRVAAMLARQRHPIALTITDECADLGPRPRFMNDETIGYLNDRAKFEWHMSTSQE
jgi:hypothetical protein